MLQKAEQQAAVSTHSCGMTKPREREGSQISKRDKVGFPKPSQKPVPEELMELRDVALPPRAQQLRRPRQSKAKHNEGWFVSSP